MFFELSDKVEFVGKAAFLSDVEDGHGTVLAEQAFSEIHAGDDEVLVGRSFENGLIKHIEARLGKVNLFRHMGNRPVFVQVGKDAVTQHFEVDLGLVVDGEFFGFGFDAAVDEAEQNIYIILDDGFVVFFGAEKFRFEDFDDIGDEAAVFRVVDFIEFEACVYYGIASVVARKVEPVVNQVRFGRIEVLRNEFIEQDYRIGFSKHSFTVHKHINGLPEMQKSKFFQSLSAEKVKALFFRPGVTYSADFHAKTDLLECGRRRRAQP